MNWTDYWPVGAVAGAALVGYGELKQKVNSFLDHFELIRADLKRIDTKVESINDFLLREHKEQ
jgi:hypothetical protein